MNTEVSTRLLFGACICVPALGVLGARYLGSAPSSAEAAQQQLIEESPLDAEFGFVRESSPPADFESVASPFFFRSIDQLELAEDETEQVRPASRPST